MKLHPCRKIKKSKKMSTISERICCERNSSFFTMLLLKCSPGFILFMRQSLSTRTETSSIFLISCTKASNKTQIISFFYHSHFFCHLSVLVPHLTQYSHARAHSQHMGLRSCLMKRYSSFLLVGLDALLLLFCILDPRICSL